MTNSGKKNGPRGGLLILIGVCLFLMLVSSFSPSFNSAMRSGINLILMPMQRGMNKAGSYIFGRIEKLRDLERVQEENELMEEELAQLRQENARLKLQSKELSQLQILLKMKEQYPDYETLGAHVVGKNSGNFYQSFQIDKGSKDGVKINMNVLAGGGLAGIVTAVGDGYATVSTIINSGQYVSAMSVRSGSNLIVSGSLNLYGEGLLAVENISLNSDVERGDTIVTSNISDRYLPGLLIGFIDELSTDSNQLTKTGTLRPVTDFDSLDMVLVIMELKEGGEEP